MIPAPGHGYRSILYYIIIMMAMNITYILIHHIELGFLAMTV